MRRLGKNHGGYHGETIDIRGVLREIETAAQNRDWALEVFHAADDFNWLALRCASSLRTAPSTRRVYISAGIHGDEPAGPLAVLQLLRDNSWPPHCEVVICPCLNPVGFARNTRENGQRIDLNRDYLHLRSSEVRAHTVWLERQPRFDMSLCLHEDWESHGFYLYELNPDAKPSLAEAIVTAVKEVCPVDPSEVIEGRPAQGGIIRPDVDPHSRPAWPEAFWLLQHKTRLSYTLEAPSDYPLEVRVKALIAAVKITLA